MRRRRCRSNRAKTKNESTLDIDTHTQHTRAEHRTIYLKCLNVLKSIEMCSQHSQIQQLTSFCVYLHLTTNNFSSHAHSHTHRETLRMRATNHSRRVSYVASMVRSYKCRLRLCMCHTPHGDILCLFYEISA